MTMRRSTCGDGEGWGYGGMDLSHTISNCGWEWKTELKDVDMFEKDTNIVRTKLNVNGRTVHYHLENGLHPIQ